MTPADLCVRFSFLLRWGPQTTLPVITWTKTEACGAFKGQCETDVVTKCLRCFFLLQRAWAVIREAGMWPGESRWRNNVCDKGIWYYWYFDFYYSYNLVLKRKMSGSNPGEVRLLAQWNVGLQLQAVLFDAETFWASYVVRRPGRENAYTVIIVW